MSRGKNSFEYRLWLIELTVKNVDMPEIQAALARYGYNDKKIREGEALHQSCDKLNFAFLDKRREYYGAQEGFRVKREELEKIYSSHLRFCRVLFQESLTIPEKLGLKGRRPGRFLPWLESAKQLYAGALSDPEILKTLKARNITRDELRKTAAGLEELEELNRTKDLLRKDYRELREKRNAELKKAEQWRRELIVFAREGIEGREKLLVALGVSVPSEK